MTKITMPSAKTEILLVDDSPADLDLICDTLSASICPGHVNTVPDGEEAIAFLRRVGTYGGAVRPDLIILDLNLPRKDGRMVLADFKSEPTLQSIPVVVFTTSHSRKDIARSYELGANCYVSKPGSLEDFRKAVQSIQQFGSPSPAFPANRLRQLGRPAIFSKSPACQDLHSSKSGR
jgi:two-component system, chemotaxis family, response regulator Rcp1